MKAFNVPATISVLFGLAAVNYAQTSPINSLPVPPCAQGCVHWSSQVAGCTSFDLQCLCDTDFFTHFVGCVTSSCPSLPTFPVSQDAVRSFCERNTSADQGPAMDQVPITPDPVIPL
ncbi:hypothetical protein CVT24_005536 [Panaeolus cyanescens]|uniref:CFEM domain-containing protein n=1 Tax=Panaeolus cyanescens TaxID=181874 RepID=A0A409VQK8_9AGAR|nr:hypothetical protein CVT24_005536 [Panaeolus cyanescens]